LADASVFIEQKKMCSKSIFILSALLSCARADDYAPNQIHLSLGQNKVTEMTVTWSTSLDPLTNQQVEYWACAEVGGDSTNTTFLSPSTSTMFVDNGTLHHTQYIHRASLVDLSPDTQYCYQVNNEPPSHVYSFKTFPQALTSPKITVYGDLGLENPRSVPLLQQEVNDRRSNAIVHNGDFGKSFNF
jgi:hypothetical protein